MTQQTARDLRTAALVSDAAGHVKGTLSDPATGNLCAIGALQVATGLARLITNHLTRSTLFWLGFTGPDSTRIAAAAEALAPQLPDPCALCLRNYDKESPAVARLIHFNDHVCEGGEELTALFVQGAEKIEADL